MSLNANRAIGRCGSGTALPRTAIASGVPTTGCANVAGSMIRTRGKRLAGLGRCLRPRCVHSKCDAHFTTWLRQRRRGKTFEKNDDHQIDAEVVRETVLTEVE